MENPRQIATTYTLNLFLPCYIKGQLEVPHGRNELCKQVHKERISYYEVANLGTQDMVNFFVRIEQELLNKLNIHPDHAEVKVNLDHWQKVAIFTVCKKGLECQ